MSVIAKIRHLLMGSEYKATRDSKGTIARVANIEESLVTFYRQFIKHGDLCFDVGANVGDRTDIFLRLGGKVVCVEPQPGCVEMLMKKYHRNDNVTVVPQGLAQRSGQMALSVCEKARTVSTFSEKWKTGRFKDLAWESELTVSVTTLEELIRKFGTPDFCKIDVEGYEYEVFQGLVSPLRVLSFEFTKEFIDDARKCVEFLASLGRVRFNYALGDNLVKAPTLGLPKWTDGKRLLSVLEAIDNPMLWGDIYGSFG